MARWVGHCILHQPKLFQKAFTRAFGSEGQWLAKASLSALPRCPASMHVDLRVERTLFLTLALCVSSSRRLPLRS